MSSEETFLTDYNVCSRKADKQPEICKLAVQGQSSHLILSSRDRRTSCGSMVDIFAICP